ncbi:MAG: tRNA guanosine(34) transglycosylase Tgt [Rickettsiales bacterium]|nr:tRNA guanosine(34) transglycosylase Tgt [Rickettsiales bacterium]
MSWNFFKILHTYGKARVGELKTAHGKVDTPVFMPVGTLGSVKGIFPSDLKRAGVQIILGNTYHLMQRPGENLIKKMGGLQKFINWDCPILTDSGGFQIWSLSKLRKIDQDGVTFSSHIDGKQIRLTPESSIIIQNKLNSNITMALDECTNFPCTHDDSHESLKLTVKWAERCKQKFVKRKGYGLFSIVQGGVFPDLREKCAELLKQISFDGYAIGGLSVGEKHKKMIEIVDHTTNFLPENKPRYLMGVGRPIDIINAVEKGVDMFDCVLPTRFGRNGRAFTTSGEINLKNAKFAYDETPLDEKLDCFVSKNFSKSYIHHLTRSNEILSSMIISLNNIFFYQNMMTDLRESIMNGNYDEVKNNYKIYHGEYERI